MSTSKQSYRNSTHELLAESQAGFTSFWQNLFTYLLTHFPLNSRAPPGYGWPFALLMFYNYLFTSQVLRFIIASSPLPHVLPLTWRVFCFVVSTCIKNSPGETEFLTARVSLDSSFSLRCLLSADESSPCFHLHFSCPSIFYFKNMCNGLVPPLPEKPLD